MLFVVIIITMINAVYVEVHMLSVLNWAPVTPGHSCLGINDSPSHWRAVLRKDKIA